MPEYNLNLLRLVESSSNAKAKLQSKSLIDSGLCYDDELSMNATLNIPNPILHTAPGYSHAQRFATSSFDLINHQELESNMRLQHLLAKQIIEHFAN